MEVEVDEVMAKKRRVSIVENLEETVSDMANAVSIAATGSEIGILELAAEDELSRRPAKKRKKKPTKKRKVVAKKPSKPSKPVQRKRTVKRRTR
jgi:hypothetical protein